MSSIGKRRTRVEFLRKTRVKDAAGQSTDSWELIGKAWGDFRYQSGMSAVKADAQTSSTKSSLRISYRPDITADLIAQIQGIKFDIEAVMPDLARRKFVDIVLKDIQ